MDSKELLPLVRERLNRHPVLAAMATRVDVMPAPPEALAAYAVIRILFDSPALPKKQACELQLCGIAFDSRADTLALDDWLDIIEKDVAATIRAGSR